tara:strand:+ start:3178 stop:3459 length:282 start_codon:yes stop_codon:yes gene_type:complete
MLTYNDVITILTLNGEFVGKFKEETAFGFRLEDPRLFMQNEEGTGFIPTISMTGKQEPTSVLFYKNSMITAPLETAVEVSKAYTKSVSRIELL